MSKIRLLIMHQELSVGGAEKVLLDMLDRLDKDKYDITLLLRSPSMWDDRVPKGVKVQHLLHRGHKSGGALRARLYKYLLMFAPWLIYALRGAKGRFDVAVSFIDAMLWYLPSARANCRVSWVHSDYSALEVCPEVKSMGNKTGLLARMITRRRNRIINSFDKVVFVAQSAVKGFVQKTGFAPEKTAVCYNINNKQRIYKLAAEPITDREWTEYGGRKICTVGRIADQKAMHRLIPLMQHLKADGMELRLYVVGDGLLRDKLQRSIDEAGLHDDIVLLGTRDNPYKYIAASELLVCSSLFEAYCTVTKESILLETPFVTTACSGMEEQVGGTKAGLIVENGEDTLYPAVKAALTDGKLYSQMKADIKARRTALSDEKSLEAIDDLLTECANRGRQ